jgi:hypothetical protein
MRSIFISLFLGLSLVSIFAATESAAKMEILALNRNSTRANIVLLENRRTEYRVFYPKIGSAILSDLNLYSSVKAESSCALWRHSSFGIRLYFEGREMTSSSFSGPVLAPKTADLIVLNSGEALLEKINAVVKRDADGGVELVYYDSSGVCYRFGPLSAGRYELQIFYDKFNTDANVLKKAGVNAPLILSQLISPRFALWLIED